MPKTPLLFFGHGSPMHALGGPIAEEWKALGKIMPKPKAVLMVSAHWFMPETAITAMERPRTIHDFGGFPRPLYEQQYPAPGAPWLAERVAQVLAPTPVRADHDWGLDHGTWAVLKHVWPDADVPVAQLSIDRRAPAPYHYELGRKLAPLREENVLIAGSGDIVHNLRAMRDGEPYPWAATFNSYAKEKIASGDHVALMELTPVAQDAALSIPTPEHYFPLLYVLGAADPGESVSFFTDVIDLGSVSMTGFRIG